MAPITPVTSSASSAAAPTTANLKKIQSDFQALSTALQSGNLGSAQQAYGALQNDAPTLFDSSQGDSSTGAATTALNNLGVALQSGNLSGAQQAFSSLQQSVPGQGQSVHGHHGHHHGGGTDQSTSTGMSAISGGSTSIGSGFSAVA